MARKRTDFDGVIVGAGQHGLILGTYLARAGLRVAVVERRLSYGGGLTTEEVTLPGFYHNLHSVNHFAIRSAPWFRDLELDARVDYIEPRYEFAQPHQDGSALVFSRDIDETVKSIAHFSPADAATFRDWNRRAEEMTRQIFMIERFGEPLAEDLRAEVLDQSEIGREFLRFIALQPGEVVDDLFESEQVKVLFLFKLSLFGTVLHETLGAKSPTGSLIRAFDLGTGYELCKGGSWNLARGLMEAYIAAGGTFINNAHVSRIVTEGGRATGVELGDGRDLTAREFVASTIDVEQTFTKLLDPASLPSEYREKAEGFSNTTWALFGLHLALREPPRYKSAEFDPNVDGALKYNIGSESVAALELAHAEVEADKIPDAVQFGAGALTTLDPSQAPPGAHTAYAWHVVPFAPDGRPERINELKDEMADRIISKWREYAPNLTDDNILARYVHTPYDYSRQIINMVEGDIMMGALGSDQVMYNHFGYRTPIEGLYMAGSATHPNGGITGGGGYICAGVIGKDIGAEVWWNPPDVEEKLRALAVR